MGSVLFFVIDHSPAFIDKPPILVDKSRKQEKAGVHLPNHAFGRGNTGIRRFKLKAEQTLY